MFKLIIKVILLIIVSNVIYSQNIQNHQLERGTAGEAGYFVRLQSSSPYEREFVAPSSINLSDFNNDLTDNNGIYSGDGIIGVNREVTVGSKYIRFINGNNWTEVSDGELKVSKNVPQFPSGFTEYSLSFKKDKISHTSTATHLEFETEWGITFQGIGGSTDERLTINNSPLGAQYLGFSDWTGLTNNSLVPKEYVDDQVTGVSDIVLTAGAGLTGGGDLTVDRTFDIGAGPGIQVNTNDIELDITNLIGITTAASTDELAIYDASNSAERKIDIQNIDISLFNNDAGFLIGNENITLSGDVTGSGTTSIGVTIASDAVEANMLNDNVISSQNPIVGSIASADEILLSDGGIIKRATMSEVETYMQNNLNFTSSSNNYVTGASFNTSSGVLTLTRSGLGDITENLDGRYSLTSHTHTTSDITDLSSYTGFDNDYFKLGTNNSFTATNLVNSANTANGSDTKRIVFAGGGDDSEARGAYISIAGQEHATESGDLFLSSAFNSNIVFNSNNLEVPKTLPINNSESSFLVLDGSDDLIKVRELNVRMVPSVPVAGYVLTAGSDNAYSWEPLPGDATTVTDGNTIDFTLTGDDIEAEIILDPASDNIITSSASGLKVTDDLSQYDNTTSGFISSESQQLSWNSASHQLTINGAGGNTITIDDVVVGGGTTGQYYQKQSNTDFDADWVTLEGLAPSGGTANQVLTKNSSTDYDYSWSTPSGGGGGGSTGIVSTTQSSAYKADFTAGDRLIKIVLTGNVTLTMGEGSSGTHLTGTLQVVQDGTGGRTITWPANVVFPGGIEPTLSSGSNDEDYFYFEWNGSDWVLMNAVYDLK